MLVSFPCASVVHLLPGSGKFLTRCWKIMRLLIVKVVFIFFLCVLLYATVAEGGLVKKLLKFLFETRNVVLFPVPIPIFRKVSTPVRHASLEVHQQEVLPAPPDYFIPPPPPPYPPFPPYDDIAYPYP